MGITIDLKQPFDEKRIGKTHDILLVILVAFLAALFFYPVYFSIISAFKTQGEIMRDAMAFPSALRLDNFIYLWNETRFPQAVVMSAFLTVTSTCLMILVIPMAAYVIERRNSKLTGLIYIFFISGMMIPFQAYMIPLFRQLKWLHLFGTVWGPIVVYISGATAFGTLLFTSFIKGIPREIEESAAIDGCSSFNTFWQIVFPLLKPCTASMVILQGLGIWNDFLMPLLVLPSDQAKTINVEIYSFVSELATRWDVLFAGSFCSMIPIILIFGFLQKYFVKGITAGTVKG